MEELTYEQERELDELYRSELRAIPKPTTAQSLTEFSLRYREVLIRRYPYFRGLFESVGLI